jgi:hypothetical protein
MDGLSDERTQIEWASGASCLKKSDGNGIWKDIELDKRRGDNMSLETT